jgi:hypothetical protein
MNDTPDTPITPELPLTPETPVSPEPPVTPMALLAPPAPPAPEAPAAPEEPPAPPSSDAAIENAKKLAIEIDNLDQGHWENFQRNYKQFFAHAKNIGEVFKTLKPLRREDREPLWLKFSQVCETARQRQKSDRETRESASRQRRELIENDLHRIRQEGLAAEAAADFAGALAHMKELREWINGKPIDDANSTPGPLQRDDRQRLWELWAQTQEEVYGRRLDVRKTNFERIEGRIAACQETADRGDAFGAVNKIKDVQGEMRGLELSKEQREILRSRLDAAWQAAQARMKEQRDERRRQRQEWIERMQGHITRWSEQITNLEGLRERIEGEIRDCEERIAAARSEDFAETVRGWIREKEERLQSIRQSVEALQEKIKSVEAKISR